ncbi:VOC family protein [Bosea sp. (in: a-proteobacteria)]|uniref:VOC family protein n=1 Tax=Bosea sp. (in: a-proteobacteria) TaxID=1871050 RepID=UPI003342CB11
MSHFLGPTRQIGYVVKDIDKAIDYWLNVMGCGPIFHIRSMFIRNFHYRGQPSDPELSIALCMNGDLQIELIQQNNDAPSAFRTFLDEGHEGAQHLAYWTTAFDKDLALCESRGLQVEQSGQSGQHGAANERLVYFSAQSHPGTMIELSEISGAKGVFFREIAEASRNWDGRDPIRYVSGPARTGA